MVQKIDKMPWDNEFGPKNQLVVINQEQIEAVDINKTTSFANTMEKQGALYGYGKPYRKIIRGQFIRD